jgi:hypothetical protein
LRATALSKGSFFCKGFFAAVFFTADGLCVGIANLPANDSRQKTHVRLSAKKMKSRHKAGTFIPNTEERLGRTTLTVVFFFVGFVLAALLLLSGLSRLPGLASLVLFLLSGLAALALSELVTLLLILFLHIVCHKYILLVKRETSALLRFKRYLKD